MEVVGGGGELGCESEWGQGNNVNGGLFAFGDLEAAVGEEEGLGGDGEAVLVEGFSGDEEVGDAVFVFERDEAVPFCGAGALSADDEAGDGEGHAVREFEEAGGGGEVFCLSLLASPKTHGVWAGGGALEREVGVEAFEGIHHGENFGLWVGGGEEVIERELLGLPEGVATVFNFGEVIEGA